MTPIELIHNVEQILAETRVAVLATIGKDGKPHMRWMVPTTLRGRAGAIFTVAAPNSAKIQHIQFCPEVEWMIQTRTLDQVIHLRGKMVVVDNPSLKAEIMEAIGSQLSTFWKFHKDKIDFVILETVLEDGMLLFPLSGKKEVCRFNEKESK